MKKVARSNLVFASGQVDVLGLTASDRRVGYEIHTQPRLFVGGFQFVLAPGAARHAPALWALPGGGRATTAQLLALARVRVWKRPRVVEVTVRYRLNVSRETPPALAMLQGHGCAG